MMESKIKIRICIMSSVVVGNVMNKANNYVMIVFLRLIFPKLMVSECQIIKTVFRTMINSLDINLVHNMVSRLHLDEKKFVKI